MQKIIFVLLKKFKNTESAQLWSLVAVHPPTHLSNWSATPHVKIREKKKLQSGRNGLKHGLNNPPNAML